MQAVCEALGGFAKKLKQSDRILWSCQRLIDTCGSLVDRLQQLGSIQPADIVGELTNAPSMSSGAEQGPPAPTAVAAVNMVEADEGEGVNKQNYEQPLQHVIEREPELARALGFTVKMNYPNLEYFHHMLWDSMFMEDVEHGQGVDRCS
jgi:hypothetical protein